MRALFIVCLLSALSALSLASGGPAGETAARAVPELQSRNMPANCQYVYYVESDLMIAGESSGEAPVAQLEYQLFDHLNRSWSAPQTSAVVATDPAHWRVDLTFVSMSQNPRVLYREIRFHTIDASGAAGPVWRSEFGRQFGEKCFPGGRDDTPFLKREVSPE